ncbi:MAG TPA: hypothetical protein PLZ51_26630, partial [Aggregatilineales bacterium]|nr:hypothetical protein [Aggregatilineales bacterium]
PVILPANVTTPVIVTVTAVNDATAEATSHLCNISAIEVTSTDPFYDALTGGAITPFDVTVLDNDIVFTVTNSGAVNEGTGANTTITYTITPNGTIANVGGSVTYTVTDTSTTTDISDFVAPLPTNVVLNFALATRTAIQVGD